MFQIFPAHTHREESSRLRLLRHRYSFHFRYLTDKIVLTLQVYFATNLFASISCGSRQLK